MGSSVSIAFQKMNWRHFPDRVQLAQAEIKPISLPTRAGRFVEMQFSKTQASDEITCHAGTPVADVESVEPHIRRLPKERVSPNKGREGPQYQGWDYAACRVSREEKKGRQILGPIHDADKRAAPSITAVGRDPGLWSIRRPEEWRPSSGPRWRRGGSGRGLRGSSCRPRAALRHRRWSPCGSGRRRSG